MLVFGFIVIAFSRWGVVTKRDKETSTTFDNLEDFPTITHGENTTEPSESTNKTNSVPWDEKTWMGVDASSLLVVEREGARFYDLDGLEKDALTIFSNHGFNLLRLRIWNDPLDGDYNTSYALELGKRALELNMSLLLDYHLSDTWADPGHQEKPDAWRNYSGKELTSAVYRFINDSLHAFIEQGITPEFVQIGNEISCGVLWDDGRICGEYNNNTQWEQFTSLLKSGMQSVRDNSPTSKLVVHTDLSTTKDYSVAFYSKLQEFNVSFDVIGLSYYPWWHGSLEELNQTLWMLATSFEQSIMIVETAYPWTLNWSDNTGNIVGTETQLLEGFPATQEGQLQFLLTLKQIILGLPKNKGLGLVYWEPAWVATTPTGSPWENLALFNFNHQAIRGITFPEKKLSQVYP